MRVYGKFRVRVEGFCFRESGSGREVVSWGFRFTGAEGSAVTTYHYLTYQSPHLLMQNHAVPSSS